MALLVGALVAATLRGAHAADRAAARAARPWSPLTLAPCCTGPPSPAPTAAPLVPRPRVLARGSRGAAHQTPSSPKTLSTLGGKGPMEKRQRLMLLGIAAVIAVVAVVIALVAGGGDDDDGDDHHEPGCQTDTPRHGTPRHTTTTQTTPPAPPELERHRSA